MRVEQTFTISRPPEVVFDYVANPANLASWQTANTLVEQLTEGQPRLGSRYRERVKPTMGKQFDQVVEFAVDPATGRLARTGQECVIGSPVDVKFARP